MMAQHCMLWDKKERKKGSLLFYSIRFAASILVYSYLIQKKKKCDSMIISVTGFRLLIFERKRRKKQTKVLKARRRLSPGVEREVIKASSPELTPFTAHSLYLSLPFFFQILSALSLPANKSFFKNFNNKNNFGFGHHLPFYSQAAFVFPLPPLFKLSLFLWDYYHQYTET